MATEDFDFTMQEVATIKSENNDSYIVISEIYSDPEKFGLNAELKSLINDLVAAHDRFYKKWIFKLKSATSALEYRGILNRMSLESKNLLIEDPNNSNFD